MGGRDSALNVVVGVDGSPSSHAALRWAVKYAELIGGDVVAVAAWELPWAYGWSAPAVDPTFDRTIAEQGLVNQVHQVLGESGAAKVRKRLVKGNPVEVLLSEAEGAKALVVGSRGMGGFRRTLLGSVSQQCAMHATCPVIIVRGTVEVTGAGTQAE
ncbi:universal stress protein [Streptomyces sp. NBC_00201]|uniref:universal stress protein n=1 Tax=unclassified Streptomyces TaxID=2593676 RepID=UPI00224C7F7C|nr:MULTISPECIES: universal stress protein [unclassified Streptomyces]MCX5063912.1 universal stress protein [Streptomyces sp. NBC_00452]MCX5251339.1 universal stress protein [Streptomyces sp. NBC_00201]MCX5294737.1 universal stress protein [Streptomyces sp. NBC_00183]